MLVNVSFVNEVRWKVIGGKMKLFANVDENSEPISIWCCAIIADPGELRDIAKFLEATAKEMEEKKGLLSKDWHREFPSVFAEVQLAVGFPQS